MAKHIKIFVVKGDFCVRYSVEYPEGIVLNRTTERFQVFSCGTYESAIELSLKLMDVK